MSLPDNHTKVLTVHTEVLRVVQRKHERGARFTKSYPDGQLWLVEKNLSQGAYRLYLLMIRKLPIGASTFPLDRQVYMYHLECKERALRGYLAELRDGDIVRGDNESVMLNPLVAFNGSDSARARAVVAYDALLASGTKRATDGTKRAACVP